MTSPFLVLILFILLVLILALIINNAFIINNALPSKMLLGGNSSINSSVTKYYYSIYNGDVGLVYDELKKLLAQYNFHEEPLTKPVHVSFGSLSGVDINGKVNFKLRIINGKKQYLDPLYVNQRAIIKNELGGSKLLSYKNKLYETIKNLIPGGIKYIPKIYTIDEFERTLLGKGFTQNTPANTLGEKNFTKNTPANTLGKAFFKGLYILKKINTEQQKGVRVFSTKDEYMNIKKELGINPHNAIIMDYITNPALTIDGKKFHLRMYVLLIVESGIKRCYIYDECWILTAELPYKKEDWLNAKIHITGAKTTMKSYKYPDDIATKIDYAKFNEFKKTLAFGTTFNTSIVYEENDIGYHIYGVDVLMSDDNNFSILEFNAKMLGHDCVQGIKNTPECDIFKKRFSRDYFSFILNCTALSVFGIKRRAIPHAEVCSYGTLSPFFHILTGDNRYSLIPYLDASEQEIESAKKIYFHNKSITLAELIKICHLDHIFLITAISIGVANNIGIAAIEPNSNILGYLTLDHNNYLNIVIIEEFQNRGIATAMIAQFLEIYAHRHITKEYKDIYMVNKSIFIEKIASKLHFTLDKDSSNLHGLYKRPCRIKNATIHKVNTYQLLTYNYIKEDNGFNSDMLIHHLNKNMVKTRSQFVHLSYTEINSFKENHFIVTKASTGSKYNKNFVSQGAELKAAVNIKYRQIKIYKDYIDTSILYENYRNYGIDKPYLHNGYRIDINLFFFLYVSKNGVKKCYYMDNNMVLISNILFEDELKSDKIKSQIDNALKIKLKNSDARHKWPDTFLKSGNDKEIASMNNSLNSYIEDIAENIIQEDAAPYSESNSGFTLISPIIDFILKENKYIPQIRYIYTHIGINGFNDAAYQDAFSKYYYDFLIKNIIYPHFGLQSEIRPILPKRCVINTELNVHADIIAALHLQFNAKRTHIDIYYNAEKIGNISLNIDDITVIILSHIEINLQYRKKNIAVNALFILMEILAAYYAPLNISLKMAFVKPMFHIAHVLKFHKVHWHSDRLSEKPAHSDRLSEKKEEYYIRLCRI